jgi:hypothetical protein
MLNLTTKVIREVRELDILTAITIIVHQRKVSLRGNVNQRIFLSNHGRNVSSVGRRNNILVLFASEDINSGKIALGVPVLSGL